MPVLDLHVDADPDHLATMFRVRSVPTLIGFHDGTEVARLVGAQPPGTVEALFAAAQAGTGTVTNRTPTAVLASRAVAGAVLVAAGFVFSTLVLVAVGAAVLAWGLGALVRRPA